MDSCPIYQCIINASDPAKVYQYLNVLGLQNFFNKLKPNKWEMMLPNKKKNENMKISQVKGKAKITAND